MSVCESRGTCPGEGCELEYLCHCGCGRKTWIATQNRKGGGRGHGGPDLTRDVTCPTCDGTGVKP